MNRGLSVYLRNKYFQQQGNKWQIIPEISRRVQFQQLNLCKIWNNLPKMDLIFLRNVLIYFDIKSRNGDLIMRKLLRWEIIILMNENNFVWCIDKYLLLNDLFYYIL